MEPSEFVRKWDDYMARVGLSSKFTLHKLPTADVRISQRASRFLVEAGLPDGSLNFDDLENGLHSVCDVYNSAYPDYWSRKDRERLTPFLMLGQDGGGNPVCLDTTNGERVVLLDHEGHFSVVEFVNSGVEELAQCILIVQEMIEEFQNEFEDAELYEGLVPASLVERTLERIAAVDSAAVRTDENCRWPQELRDI